MYGSDDKPSLIGTRLGAYEITDLVGVGGMGRVYRAHDARLGRDVAIKILDERFTARFEREVRAVAALNHPNICTLHDIGPNYLVMEFVEGHSLATRLLQRPLAPALVLHYGIQIAEALSAAHDKGIVHRDLKPENVLVTAKDHLKLVDFGLALIREPHDTTATGRLPMHRACHSQGRFSGRWPICRQSSTRREHRLENRSLLVGRAGLRGRNGKTRFCPHLTGRDDRCHSQGGATRN